MCDHMHKRKREDGMEAAATSVWQKSVLYGQLSDRKLRNLGSFYNHTPDLSIFSGRKFAEPSKFDVLGL